MSTLPEVYQRLFTAFGPQNWWPGETPFEVIVGAVLVQNTSWRNVARVIDRLKEGDLLHAATLSALPLEELEELLRPVGYYRVKARRLRNLLAWFTERFDGSVEAMFAIGQAELRRELLSLNGIGPETADSILLYAGGLPSFVIDAYTFRVMARHGWIEHGADYHALKEFFESRMEPDAARFNEFHALFVRVGKDFCRKREPRCGACPLQDLLPEGGPLEPE